MISFSALTVSSVKFLTVVLALPPAAQKAAKSRFPLMREAA